MKTKITPILALLCAILSSTSLFGQTTYTVLVSSRGESAVKEYDLAGNFLGNFVEPGSGGLSGTEDMLFHPDGSVLVTGFANTAIKRYDGATGDYLGNFTSGYSLNTPSKMSIGPDSLIYVTQWGTTQNKVVRFGLDGAFVDEFTSVGAPNGLGHVWDGDKNFYIALYGNGGTGTVHKFDSLGNNLGTFISSFLLQGPTSIWWDSNGDMLVEDFTVGKVLRYNSQGQFQGEFITGMTNPEGIAFLPNGDFLIGDWGVDAVHRFDSTGLYLDYFTSGNGLTDANSVKLRVTQSTAQGKGKPGLSLCRFSYNKRGHFLYRAGPLKVYRPDFTGVVHRRAGRGNPCPWKALRKARILFPGSRERTFPKEDTLFIYRQMECREGMQLWNFFVNFSLNFEIPLR
ncbi:MAG: NHL repeat-containing protein [Saprospirales bacterium]|nr:NHL repeat-containing protein [Saprospirales bacterium]